MLGGGRGVDGGLAEEEFWVLIQMAARELIANWNKQSSHHCHDYFYRHGGIMDVATKNAE